MKINKNAYILRQLKREYELECCFYEPSRKPGLWQKKEPKITFEGWLKQEGLLEDL